MCLMTGCVLLCLCRFVSVGLCGCMHVGVHVVCMCVGVVCVCQSECMCVSVYMSGRLYGCASVSVSVYV